MLCSISSTLRRKERECRTVDLAVVFHAVPERYYVHNEHRGETLHRSASESIHRELIALDVVEGARVLEIGTGTGYSGALLAALAGASGRVTSIDISEHLISWADRLHRQRGLTTITCHLADGMAGYPPHAPYQRLVAWCTLNRPGFCGDFSCWLRAPRGAGVE
ncbi:methyltransferase domain-containing protein [Micromonospora sp. C51]|nr:methyltransferase domain-containing protein [Micromonospora sp. C51]